MLISWVATLLRDVDFLAAVALAAIAVLGLLIAVLLMFFPRKGARVFVTRSLSRSALSLLLMALLLAAIAWLLLGD